MLEQFCEERGWDPVLVREGLGMVFVLVPLLLLIVIGMPLMCG